jgi:DNA-binding winged helix-turn-helix (wHTH) protein
MDALHFGDFVLDPRDRRLTRGGKPVELNARYFDALALLAGAGGQLVTKDRFMAEVWRGVPVTDEALTQCIRALRKALGDDAARPTYIETVPKHGYRFIAEMRADAPAVAVPVATSGVPRGKISFDGTLGGAAAGLAGGLLLALVGVATPGTGAVSALLVLVLLTMVVAVLGAAGVCGGIALTAKDGLATRAIIGGTLGGLAVGAVAKLIGVDAFHLLIGRSPGQITGALEGMVLGSVAGLCAWLALWAPGGLSRRMRTAISALAGAMAGAVIILSGGRLLSGSLASLGAQMPGSRLSLDPLGALVGEQGFGPISHVMSGAMEGGLFTAGIAAGLMWGKGRGTLPR